MPTPLSSEAAWIAVDWGTSRLRAWAIGQDGAVLADAASERGMGRLAPTEFEEALLDLVAPWLPGDRRTQVVVCGMAGARQGWHEAPYRQVPCAPVRPGALVSVPATDPRLAVGIVPGLAQDDPPDVMRGEETQLAGLLAAEPAFGGVACLPGTHSKWAVLGGGRIVRFTTFLTGELFALLADHSILRHTVLPDGWNDGDFASAVEEAYSSPAALPGALFALRAGPLLGAPPAQNLRSRLSGLLIGAEIAAMRSRLGSDPVHVIGSGDVSTSYNKALNALGIQTFVHDAEKLTLAGLAAARREGT